MREIKISEYREMLEDIMTIYYQGKKRAIDLNLDQLGRLDLYRRRFISFDASHALNFFINHNDRLGLELLIKSQNIPEAIKRDCNEYLNPTKKVSPSVKGRPDNYPYTFGNENTAEVKARRAAAHHKPKKTIEDSDQSFENIVRLLED